MARTGSTWKNIDGKRVWFDHEGNELIPIWTKQMKNDYQNGRRMKNPNSRKVEYQRQKEHILEDMRLPKRRWMQAKTVAKKRDLSFSISFEKFISIIDDPCFYCNNELGKKCTTGCGMDRMDNDVGYELGNVVSCCKECNIIKGNVLTPFETKCAISAILMAKQTIRDAQMQGLI